VRCSGCGAAGPASKKEDGSLAAVCRSCSNNSSCIDLVSPLNQVAAELSSCLQSSRLVNRLLPADADEQRRKQQALRLGKSAKPQRIKFSLADREQVDTQTASADITHTIGGGIDAQIPAVGGNKGASAAAAPAAAAAVPGSALSVIASAQRVQLTPLFQRRCIKCVSRGLPGILTSASPNPFAGLVAAASAASSSASSSASAAAVIAASGWTTAKLYRKSSSVRTTLPSVYLISKGSNPRCLRNIDAAAALFLKEWRQRASATGTAGAESGSSDSGAVEALLLLVNPTDRAVLLALPARPASEAGSHKQPSLVVAGDSSSSASASSSFALCGPDADATCTITLKLDAYDELAALGIEDDEEEEQDATSASSKEQGGSKAVAPEQEEALRRLAATATATATAAATATTNSSSVAVTAAIAWQRSHAMALRVHVPVTTGARAELGLTCLVALHPAVLADRRGGAGAGTGSGAEVEPAQASSSSASANGSITTTGAVKVAVLMRLNQADAQ
jgi:hypothetical protein